MDNKKMGVNRLFPDDLTTSSEYIRTTIPPEDAEMLKNHENMMKGVKALSLSKKKIRNGKRNTASGRNDN